jgi:NADPH2:quinone reductase
VIIYTHQDFVKESQRLTNGVGPVYIIDGVGKDTFTKNLDAVATRGHVTIFGASSGVADPVAPNSLQQRCITIHGGSLFNFVNTREEMLMRANAVMEGIKAGWLNLRIAHVFTLKQAVEAQELLENRQSTGKVVLNCQS